MFQLFHVLVNASVCIPLILPILMRFPQEFSSDVFCFLPYVLCPLHMSLLIYSSSVSCA